MEWEPRAGLPDTAVAEGEFADYVYDQPHAVEFVEDMKRAGFGSDDPDGPLGRVDHYRGRGFREGPSVTVDDLQEALSNTRVPCTWDSMGHGYVVHPSQSAAPAETIYRDDEPDDKPDGEMSLL